MREQLAGLSGQRASALAAKIDRWEGLITATTDKVDELSAELAIVNAGIGDIQDALTTQQAICDGDPVGVSAGTYYLHADHLGRPQLATDETGNIVWDMGADVTPFGDAVNTAGAFAQKLMFPGQYADEETGLDLTLSHNWHRNYDPTLGRYLQSDPIGLAGGLNRYAYVGGNPVGWVDPDGLSGVPAIPPGSAYAEARDIAGRAWAKPGSRHPIGAYIAAGIYIGAFGAAVYYEYCNDSANDNPSRAECRKIKDQCIKGCSDFVLGKPKKHRVGLAGDDFSSCVRQCMDRNGC